MRFVKSTIMVAISVLALAACDQLSGNTVATTEAAPEATIEATPVAAGEAYVGTWAADPADCNKTQDQEGAPVVFTSDGYDAHEAHCTWANVQELSATSWRIAAACQVEGDEASLGFDITVAGDTMEMEPGGRLVRCRAS